MLQPQQQAAGSAAMAVAVGRAAVGAGAGGCGGSGLRCVALRGCVCGEGDALRSPSAPGLPGGGLVAVVQFVRSFVRFLIDLYPCSERQRGSLL